MLYILSDMLNYLIYVNVFVKMINNVIDFSMLSVIMCYFKHFRVTVL